jgi:glycosyltransferase involved in cell wall biosynthesis
LHIHFFVQFSHEQGTYFRFHNLALGLAELGHVVAVFACDHDTASAARTELRNGIPYHIVPSSGGTTLVSPFCHPLNAFRRWLLPYPKCDVAHLFQPFPNAAFAWGKSQARVRFYDWDDLWVGGLLGNGKASFRVAFDRAVTGWFERQLPLRATHVTTCSGFLRDLALSRRAAAASVIYNGIQPYQPLPRAAARTSLGLSPSAIYAGFMGRTCNELSWCIDALAGNLDRWPDLRLALCGFPAFLLDAIPERIRERTDFLGQLSPAATRDFAAALDLGLLPLEDSPFNQSRFPIKFAEYMAAGTPLLASEIGEPSVLARAFPWVLKAGKTYESWLAAFSRAIDQIAADAMPAVDQDVVRAAFSWNHLAANLLDLYHAHLSPVSPQRTSAILLPC